MVLPHPGEICQQDSKAVIWLIIWEYNPLLYIFTPLHQSDPEYNLKASLAIAIFYF